eukprot:442158-Pleurochrysis_carterae.AAC.2
MLRCARDGGGKADGDDDGGDGGGGDDDVSDDGGGDDGDGGGGAGGDDHIDIGICESDKCSHDDGSHCQEPIYRMPPVDQRCVRLLQLSRIPFYPFLA